MTDEDAFTAALPLGPAQRAAYLRAACPDPAQRARVEALLAAHDEANSFLERPVPGRAEVGTNTRTFHADTPGEPADENDPLLLLAPPSRPDSKGRIGHYEVLQVLGRGGFGAVYRAFDEVLHRVVAVKVLLRHIAATSPARKRFLREARTLAQVRHENVVQVYEVGEAPLPYLVMEFVPGETLQARLERVGPVEPAEVVRTGRQIAEGLAAAHATGLVHRDIKPGNVLLEGPQLRVKITDFGLARAADDASISQSGLIAGTPLYMAPEQAKGDHIDHRADLFSLGSVLYQMLSGRPPFRAANTLAVLKRVCDDDPRPIRELIPESPKWLCDIVAKLHAKNPDDRFQTARELADVLAACEERLKTSSNAGGSPKVAPRKAPTGAKPRWKWAAVGALVLGAVVACALTLPGLLKENEHGQRKVEPENPVPQPPNQPPPLAVAPFDAATAAAHQKAWADHLGVPVQFTNALGMTFHLVPPGRFQMGIDPGDINTATWKLTGYGPEFLTRLWPEAVADASPRHEVTLTRAFYIQTHEVRHGWYRAVLGADAHPDRNAPADGPVTQFVSWNDALAFCNALSAREGRKPQYAGTGADAVWLAGRDGYRLPTEAEWEWACRAGTATAWLFGNDPTDQQLFRDCQSLLSPTPRPNSFGLFDVYGGTAEWMWDGFAPYRPGAATDPVTQPGALPRIHRGGSKHAGAGFAFWLVNSFARNGDTNYHERGPFNGLGRVVLPVPDAPAARAALFAPRARPGSPTSPGVPPKAIRGNDSCIAYQYSPDGKWLVTRDYANNTIGAMRVWEVATGEVRATIPNSLGSGGAFSPDSKLLAHPEREGGRVHLVVRNVGTFDVVKRMDCAANNVEGIAFDRTGTVVAACVDYDVVLWTARTGAEVLRLASDFHGLLGLAFSPTADRLLLQEDRGSFQRDGRWDHDSRIHLYDTDPKSPTYKQRLRTWDAPNDGFAFGMIHFSPDGARALFCRGESGLTRVAVHDVKTGAKVRDIVPQQTYTQITIGAISPDGKRVVLRHGPDGVHVSVWNLDTGARVSGFDLTGKAHRAFAVDPTFRTACVGFHTGSEAKFYDLATGTELVPGTAPLAAFTDADAKRIAALPAKDQVEAVRAELKKRNPQFEGPITPTFENDELVGLTFPAAGVTDLSPLRGVPALRELNCNGERAAGSVADLSPLKGLKLTKLTLSVNPVTDLSPLMGMPLTDLHVDNSQVADLSPLAEMPLKVLNCSYTRVTDLAPLKNLPLRILWANHTNVADLGPLKAAPLEWITFQNTKVTDTAVLKGKPLSQIYLDFDAKRDGALLRGIPTLERINDKPATEFLKEFGSVGVPFTDADVKRIAALTAAEQLEEVRRELKKRNPGYDGTFTQTIENDVVVALRLPSGTVSDLSPVRALTRLKRLEAEGRLDAPGRFSDLTQLKGLALTELWVRHNRVADLTPLKGMPLQWLWLDGNPVTDFAPLKAVPLKGLIVVGFPVQSLKGLGGLKIESLDCSGTQLADLTLLKDMPLKGLTLHATPVSDLTPLKGMRLNDLNIERTKVSDLSPLTGMPLTDLNIVETEVTDLTPLKGLPLKAIVLDYKPERDALILKGIKTLEFINRKPVADFWKELEKK